MPDPAKPRTPPGVQFFRKPGAQGAAQGSAQPDATQPGQGAGQGPGQGAGQGAGQGPGQDRGQGARSTASGQPSSHQPAHKPGDPPPVIRGIFVATPAYGASCYLPYVSGMLSLQRACLEQGIAFQYFFLSGTALIHEQRNVAVEAFEASRLSHLLFVDADIGFEGPDILRMLAADKEVVLGPYPAKHINWAAVAHAARSDLSLTPDQLALASADYASNFYGIEGTTHFVRDALMEVYAGGTGLMMIARHVFERLERAYPETRVNVPPAYRHLVPGATEMFEHFEFAREPDGRTLSEDINFCCKWRSVGGRLFAGTWLRTVHVGPYLFPGNLPALLGA